MIGRLIGKLIEKKPPHLLLDVQGVGYEVQSPMTTFYELAETGCEVVLHTHLVIREDAHQLYGFATLDARRLFRSLIKVNGVGPKLALTILSSMQPNEFVFTINNNDASALVRLPGVGKKTAERLIIEMRDRLKEWDLGASQPASQQTGQPDFKPAYTKINDAISALIALGYKPQDASKVVTRVGKDFESSEEIIRHALKEIA